MDILNTISLESNRQIKINFDGGDLSSHAGLILMKEFACKLGFIKILQSMFKTNDSASFRLHKDDQNLWQMIYQILGTYFEDDCADELTNDPVLTAILEKKSLASQPTLFRFFNRMDETTLDQFYSLMLCSMVNSCIRQAHGNIHAVLYARSKSLRISLSTCTHLS